MLRHACGFKLANDRDQTPGAPLLTRLNEEDKVIRLRLTRLSGDGGHLRQQIALLRKERDPHFAFEGSSTSRTSKTG